MLLNEVVQVLSKYTEYFESLISPDDCDYEQSQAYLYEILHNRKNIHELRRILSRLEHRMDIEYIVMISGTNFGDIALWHFGFDVSEVHAYSGMFDDGFDISGDPKDWDLGL